MTKEKDSLALDERESDREILLLMRVDVQANKDTLRDMNASVDKILSRQHASEERAEALQELLERRLTKSDGDQNRFYTDQKQFYEDLKAAMKDSTQDARNTRKEASDALQDVWSWFKRVGVWLLLGAAAAERFGIIKLPGISE